MNLNASERFQRKMLLLHARGFPDELRAVDHAVASILANPDGSDPMPDGLQEAFPGARWRKCAPPCVLRVVYVIFADESRIDLLDIYNPRM